jgi:hypothetical protein
MFDRRAWRSRGKPSHALYWSALSLVVLALDYAMGPVIQFPAAFVLPVSLAAWWSGRLWGLLLAVLLPLARLHVVWVSNPPWTMVEATINAVIRMGVLGMLAVLVDRVAVQREALSRRVELLEGVLPVCAVCKRVRDEEARWHPIERYLLMRSTERGRPEVCPDCAREAGEAFDRR